MRRVHLSSAFPTWNLTPVTNGEHARAVWAAKGKQAFEHDRKERKEETRAVSEEAPHDEV
jgi:hypothetical protein